MKFLALALLAAVAADETSDTTATAELAEVDGTCGGASIMGCEATPKSCKGGQFCVKQDMSAVSDEDLKTALGDSYPED